ncbi:PAS domain-containing protein [Muricoccus aerilatus]|uniref:PAS domain-containing protein n=1 Tax=Muricoccus aerilatus TaxID=452982 RepID=UPI000A05BECB|nr:PAS domain-containing protein [Roseomonas aerilata]
MTPAASDEDQPTGHVHVQGTTSVPPSFSDSEAALLRTAIEAIGEAVVITGAELDAPGPTIEYVNPAFCRMTGYTSEEVLGRSPRFLQGPKTNPAVLHELRVALRSGQRFQGEAVNYRKDGSEYIVEWLITPVVQDGRVTQWVATQRDVTLTRRAEEQRALLAAEVNHRVYNTLTTVEAVAAQTAPGAETASEFKIAFRRRLSALVRAHRLLGRRQWADVPLCDLAAAQVTALTDAVVTRLDVQGPEVLLRPNAAVAIGLALHELAANAVAHGALSVPGGHVRLRWSVQSDPIGERLIIYWVEVDGPPVPEQPQSRGFGSRLIERGLSHELQARAQLSFEPTGLRCQIDMPLGAVASRGS